MGGQVPQAPGLKYADDQQDGVGTGRPRLVDLVGVHDEFLAQHRDAHHRAHGGQVGKRTAEELGIREHRDRRCTRAHVGERDRHRVVGFAQDPAGGRATLALGDHRRVPGFEGCAQA